MKTTVKIGLGTTVGIVAVLGVLLAFVFFQTSRLLVDQIEAQAMLLVKVFEAEMDQGVGQEVDGRNSVFQDRLGRLAKELPGLQEVNVYRVADPPSVVASTDEAQLGKQADPEDVEAAHTDQAVVLMGAEDGVEFVDVTAPLHARGTIGYVIGIKLSVQDAWDGLRTLAVQTIAVGIAAAAVLGIVMFFVLRRMRRTLGAEPEDLDRHVTELAAGRSLSLKDESQGVLATLADFGAALDRLTHDIEQVAGGDFTTEVRPRSGDDRLALSLAGLVRQLGQTIGEVRQAMDQALAGSDQVRQASASLSKSTADQAASLEQVSASVVEVGQRARGAADQAVESQKRAQQTLDSVRTGGAQMVRLVEAMTAIEQASRQIQGVVKTIDDIAFQTNLLSLNANVEASRAGSSGRGFAVVAGEVRNLSVRSATAVQETTALVARCLDTIEKGGALVKEVEVTLAGIGNQAEELAATAGLITEAGQGQASALREIEAALGHLDRATQANAATAEQTASASEGLATQAYRVQSLLDRFRWSRD